MFGEGRHCQLENTVGQHIITVIIVIIIVIMGFIAHLTGYKH